MPVQANKTYVGIVQDNQDPQKLGRVKVRVVGVFDQMELKDIPWASPWKDLNGNGFNVPEVGKLMTVIFDSGNEYKPEYIYADFYNINLEKKIKSLSGANYASMKALIFDHKTQIYVNDAEGLKIDYKFNNINIRESQIDIGLKDNFTKVNIGDASADQQAILGTSFLQWFDSFVNALMCLTGATPYIGAPLVPEPNFLRILQDYHLLKDPKFLSKNVYIVDNQCVTSIKNTTSSDPNLRVNDSQIGDNIKTNVVEMKTPPQNDPQTFEPTQGSGEEPTPLEPQAKPGDQNSSANIPGKNSSESTNVPTQSLENAPVPPVPEGELPKPPNPPIEPKPAERVQSILDAIRRGKDSSTGSFYKIEEQPYVVNLVAVRKSLEGFPYPNSFSDEMWAIWKNDEGIWEHQKWSTSTVPGLNTTINGEKFLLKQKFGITKEAAFHETYSKKLKRMVCKGVPILVPAQYDFYIDPGFGADDESSNTPPQMQGKFITGKQLACYRDRNFNTPNMTFSEPDDYFDHKIDTKCQGIGIFMAFVPTSDQRDLGFMDRYSKNLPHNQPSVVDTWGMGSCTIPNQNDWIQLLSILSKSIEKKGKNIIKFTLLKESDINSQGGVVAGNV